jgi:acid stress chaperone HdeB
MIARIVTWNLPVCEIVLTPTDRAASVAHTSPFNAFSAGRMLVKVTALVAAVLVAAAAANAQVVDLSTIKCREFIELPKETANAITMWLDGYFTDEEDPAVVDLDKLKGKAEKLGAFCAANPRMSLMTAAENVMAK